MKSNTHISHYKYTLNLCLFHFELTDEIGDQAAVGESSGGVVEVGHAVGPEIGLVEGDGVDVVVVSGVEDGVAEDEEVRRRRFPAALVAGDEWD